MNRVFLTIWPSAFRHMPGPGSRFGPSLPASKRPPPPSKPVLLEGLTTLLRLLEATTRPQGEHCEFLTPGDSGPGLVLFVIFRRVRSLITRQKIRPPAMLFRMGIFLVLGLVLLFALTQPAAPGRARRWGWR